MDYLNDGRNLNDDLAYYDGLLEKTKSDFYKDNAKILLILTLSKKLPWA